jgi:uncharacterized membrane protein
VDRLHRQLVAAVVVLAVVAIAGMAALWPAPFDVPPAESPGELFTGRVVAIDRYVDDVAPGFAFSGASARIDVEILDGSQSGEVIRIDTLLDGYPEFNLGDRVRVVSVDGGLEQIYSIYDFERTSPLLWLVALFVGVVLLVGRWHGFRSLIGLVLSLGIVVGFIVPAILAGESPFAVAFFGALAVMLVTLPLSHGINPMTGASIVGTAGALTLTILLGVWFIDAVHLTGFSSEEANMARYAVDGLDPKGLVLAGMIIAALGVLDDVTVSQASTVFALRSANAELGWNGLFSRAMTVGRDHIASTVNTLVLAYVGASLALLVLFSTSGVAGSELLTSEIIAEEIVKTLVGSIGLIAAVPFTTALAASLAIRQDPSAMIAGAHGHHHGGHDHTSDALDSAASSDDGSQDHDYEAMINTVKYGSPQGPDPENPPA